MLTNATVPAGSGGSAPGLGRTLVSAVAVAAACGAIAGAARATSVVYSSTGAEQQFTVPAGVSSLHVVAVGGRGGASCVGAPAPAGGYGATATADLHVSAREVLYVEVGGSGGSCVPSGGGGFNGGGNDGAGRGGGGGGGASDVRTMPAATPGSLTSRLVVAGAGGGAGAGAPTAFGGDAGMAAPLAGGGAGTQTAGGAGSSYGGYSYAGSPGALGIGGSASNALAYVSGGGGGGGLYGGGAGSGANCVQNACYFATAGGGGSSGFPEPYALIGPGTAAGDTTGVPSVTITYTAPPVNTSPPQLSGEPTEGKTLSSTAGTWENNPRSTQYRWQRCRATCTDISGVTGAKYRLTALDVGARIQVVVTASNSDGSTIATSAPFGPVSPDRAHVQRWLHGRLVPHGKRASLASVNSIRGYIEPIEALTRGTLTVRWTFNAGARTIVVATGTAYVPTVGHTAIRIRLTRKGASLLAQKMTVTLTATGTFTRRGASPVSATRTFALRR